MCRREEEEEEEAGVGVHLFIFFLFKSLLGERTLFFNLFKNTDLQKINMAFLKVFFLGF